MNKLHIIGFVDNQACDSATVRAQIDALRSVPCALVVDGQPVTWDDLDNPAETRTLLQFVLGDRSIRVDKKTLMADRPPFAVATEHDGKVVRLEFYEGHDALAQTYDLRSPELAGREIPDYMSEDDHAYDPIAFLAGIFGEEGAIYQGGTQ